MNWQTEIDELHAFFEGYFLGMLPADDVSRFAGVLDEEFTIVGPDGSVSDRATTVEMVGQGHNHATDMTIECLDHRDLQAPLPGGGRHFSADEPGPHHCHPLRGGLQLGPDGQAVVQVPQGVDAVEPVGGQLPTPGPGGDENAVGGNRRAVVEGDGAAGRIKGGGSAAQPPVGL